MLIFLKSFFHKFFMVWSIAGMLSAIAGESQWAFLFNYISFWLWVFMYIQWVRPEVVGERIINESRKWCRANGIYGGKDITLTVKGIFK